MNLLFSVLQFYINVCSYDAVYMLCIYLYLTIFEVEINFRSTSIHENHKEYAFSFQQVYISKTRCFPIRYIYTHNTAYIHVGKYIALTLL